MVNFTCNLCGETLRKNQVDKHCQSKCKNAWNFTCIDCQQVFAGFEYVKHTECLSETQKYQGKFLEKKRKGPDTKEEEKKEEGKEKEETKPTKPHWKGWHHEAKKIMETDTKLKYDKLYKKLWKAYSESDKYNGENADDLKQSCEDKLLKHGFAFSTIKYISYGE